MDRKQLDIGTFFCQTESDSWSESAKLGRNDSQAILLVSFHVPQNRLEYKTQFPLLCALSTSCLFPFQKTYISIALNQILFFDSNRYLLCLNTTSINTQALVSLNFSLKRFIIHNMKASSLTTPSALFKPLKFEFDNTSLTRRSWTVT